MEKVIFGSLPSEESKQERMKFIALMTNKGQEKGGTNKEVLKYSFERLCDHSHFSLRNVKFSPKHKMTQFTS